MSESRYKTDWLVIPGVILLLLLAAMGIYSGAYFWRGTYSIAMVSQTGSASPRIQAVDRLFPTKWETTLFGPGAAVESWLTGHAVNVYTLSDFDLGGIPDGSFQGPEPFLDDSAP